MPGNLLEVKRLDYSKLKGITKETSALVIKDLLLFELNNVFGSNVPFDDVESITFPVTPDTMLFFTYITPFCASVVVFTPSINIPNGQPITNALFILFCDDLLKCIPLLNNELIGLVVVANGPTKVTFHHVGDVLGEFS